MISVLSVRLCPHPSHSGWLPLPAGSEYRSRAVPCFLHRTARGRFSQHATPSTSFFGFVFQDMRLPTVALCPGDLRTVAGLPSSISPVSRPWLCIHNITPVSCRLEGRSRCRRVAPPPVQGSQQETVRICLENALPEGRGGGPWPGQDEIPFPVKKHTPAFPNPPGSTGFSNTGPVFPVHKRRGPGPGFLHGTPPFLPRAGRHLHGPFPYSALFGENPPIPAS